jgi:hypothetical protein
VDNQYCVILSRHKESVQQVVVPFVSSLRQLWHVSTGILLSLNGIQGSFYNVDVQSLVNGANSSYPGCDLTSCDLYMGALATYTQAGAYITTLDAATIRISENNIP